MIQATHKCRHCSGSMTFSRGCGVYVCDECDYHEGLARCFCGWSLTSPGQGRQELEEMGEQIDPD